MSINAPSKLEEIDQESIKKSPLIQRFPYSCVFASACVASITALLNSTFSEGYFIIVAPMYLLGVQVVAVLSGSLAAVLAAILSFLAFDWFFVEPKHQFTIGNPYELIALCVFLGSAILVGQLTAMLQRRALIAQQRELAANALAKASWTVASEHDTTEAIRKLLVQLSRFHFVIQAAVWITDDHNQFVPVAQLHQDTPIRLDVSAARFVRDTGTSIGLSDNKHWDKALGHEPGHVYVRLQTDGKYLGLFQLLLKDGSVLSQEDRRIIDSISNHMGIVLERGHLTLAQAKAQAIAEASKLQTALLQMITHDFRSPLASIKATVSSLAIEHGEPVDPATQHILLQAIEQETDRLNRMVGNLLDLSRLEAHAWQPQREACSLSELIGSVLDSFNSEENHRIRLHIDSNCREIFVDSVQMVQVIHNLLENSLKYSSIETEVELHARADGTALIFQVLDRGQGLPAGEENSIFQAFYRAREHRESSSPGMGMGLAVCKGLVEAHGGCLTAYNRDGGGAAFCVRLPPDTVIVENESISH